MYLLNKSPGVSFVRTGADLGYLKWVAEGRVKTGNWTGRTVIIDDDTNLKFVLDTTSLQNLKWKKFRYV
jgi:hypothetical protein